MKKNKMIRRILTITIALILLDQAIKMLVVNYFQEPIEKGIVGIVLIQNTGMAFGFSSGNTKNIVLTIFVLLIVVNFIRNQKDRIDGKTAVALSLVLAGGMSNLIDRILKDGIVDFIKVKNFAIFNVADCYVVLGWILLIVFLIKYNKEIVGGKNCEKQ